MTYVYEIVTPDFPTVKPSVNYTSIMYLNQMERQTRYYTGRDVGP
jgi:hypothetical protein